MNAGQFTAQAQQAGRRADSSKMFDRAVRVGIIAYGIVHLIIAWIAIQLALGNQEGEASTDGALSQMAQTSMGGFLMWVVTIGFAALVLWKATDAIWGHTDEEGKKRVFKRVGSGFKAVLYGLLGLSALQFAMGNGSGGGGGTDSMTAKVMEMPGGQLLVGLIGVAVFAYGARLIYRGLSEKFMDKLTARGQSGDAGKAFVTFGKVGYVAKGVALFVIAGLFLWAAIAHDPKKSGGLDQALQTVLEQPFGVPMLLVLAAGIGCYGVFCFAWARHLDR